MATISDALNIKTSPRDAARRVAALAEVCCAFAVVHLGYRTFKHFTSLGRAEGASGLNYWAGAAMILFSVAAVAICGRSASRYGLTATRWRLHLKVGVLWGLILVIAMAAVAMSCDRHRPVVTSAVPATAPAGDAESELNHAHYPNTAFLLIRRATAAEAPAEEGLALDLLARMAADPLTLDTARRMYGVPLEFDGFVAADIQPSEPLDAPPKPGFIVALRVRQRDFINSRIEAVTLEADVGTSYRLPPSPATARSTAKPTTSEVAERVPKSPDPLEAMHLLIEDYMLRHHTGWSTHEQPEAEPTSREADEAQARQTLDHEIAQFAQQAREYFTTP